MTWYEWSPKCYFCSSEWMKNIIVIIDPWTLQFSVRSNSVWISRKNCLLIHIHSAITLLTFFSPTLITITLPRKRCACGKVFIETLLLNLRHTFYYVNENLSLLCIKGYRNKTHVLQSFLDFKIIKIGLRINRMKLMLLIRFHDLIIKS